MILDLGFKFTIVSIMLCFVFVYYYIYYLNNYDSKRQTLELLSKKIWYHSFFGSLIFIHMHIR